MNKICKICIMLFVIQFIFIFLNNSYAKVYNSLSDFVEAYGIKNMTNEEIEDKRGELLRKLEDYNEDNAITISTDVATILGNADNFSNYDEKMEFLEGEFSAQALYALDEEQLDYLYYGYMLGSKWIIYKDNKEETNKPDNNEKTEAQQFDEKYNEYKNLTEEEKKDILTLQKYKDILNQLYNQLPEEDKTDERLEKLDEVETACEDADTSASDIPDTIYQYPKNNGGSTSSSLDDMIGDADSFLSKADRDVITAESLQSFSQTLYNILLTVGIIIAVLVGLVIGIRFMIGGAEEKANIKELLVPYVVGCIVVFGAFAIWKIVVTILQEI